jgi:hypothetical protein
MSLYSSRTYDNATLLRAAGLIAATATETIILDIGAGLIDADWINDVLAIETATGDEKYTVILEGSNVAAMTSGVVELARADLGNVTTPVTVVTGTGRFLTPFRNEINGTIYRYCRVQTTVAGTVATGLNFVSWIAKDDD